ncbi:MAG: endonuclease/exonuclease/phosphatase family protein [Acidobacteria bacterium]|nr:endonuclease/exonuclease/phosphatase family protein [Acidobacteriota bacterium]
MTSRQRRRGMVGAFGLCVAAWLAIGAEPVIAAQSAPGQPLTVMSFNLRYGTANDGENHWTRRRPFLIDVVREADADVIGVQEALDGQIQALLDALPAYAAVGVGRDDGRTRGEYAAILYRRTRFRVADSGTFWLSDTPEVIGSTSWGNTITRICTWARFIDRDGRAFWHFNVHFDHQSQPSRERSAALLAERLRARRHIEEPALVTGDFNAGETNPAVSLLTRGSSGSAPLLVDSFRVLHPDERSVGTFTGFKLDATTGEKIDYVLVPPGTSVLDAAIVRTSRDGRYPSDHFPVTARVILGAGR